MGEGRGKQPLSRSFHSILVSNMYLCMYIQNRHPHISEGKRKQFLKDQALPYSSYFYTKRWIMKATQKNLGKTSFKQLGLEGISSDIRSCLLLLNAATWCSLTHKGSRFCHNTPQVFLLPLESSSDTLFFYLETFS